MMRKRASNVLRAGATYIIVLLGLAFFILPFFWIIYSSFRGHDAIFSERFSTPWREFTLDNYRTMILVAKFPLYFLNSLRIALCVTATSLVFSVLGAYGLSRYRIRGKNVYLLGIFGTHMFPLVLLIIPIYIIVFGIGLLDTTLGVVLSQMILVLPFCVWMLKGYFDNLPEDLDDAARIDGCSLFQTLSRIILPVAAPGIMVAAFYSFVVSWGDYLVISVINQSERTATVPLIIQRLSAALRIRWGQVAALCVLTIVPTVILFSFVQRYLVEGLTAGAIKSE
jgi:ABC-type glycerol-3-phosphate transport system permease component